MAGRILTLLLAVLTCFPRSLAAQQEVPQWIVVTAPAFRSALAPLCERRRAEGMRVVVVQTTDVLSAEQIRRGDGSLLKDRVQRLCWQSPGRNYVLLVGTVQAADLSAMEKTVVPPLVGSAGRMKGQPSDNGYGCWDKKLMPAIAVGRFPARSAAEAAQMVQKTLSFERDCSPGLWRNRATLLVGHPGGATYLEKRFAEWFIQEVARARFDRVAPMWVGSVVIHAPGSPFRVPDDRLHDVSLSYLEQGQMFAFYVGHSNAAGLWSQWARFLDRDDWAKMRIPSGPGIFFTCGCFGCQLEGNGGEGYGLAAMRNPYGPVAVLGAHGESYAAMGQLAMDGMLQCLSTSDPPPRLAAYWLAAKAGIATGKMDPLTFQLYDQGDGSRGKTSLEEQRREHLEMWMLLGDPALRLPLRRPTISLAATGPASAGKTIKIRGTVPAPFAETTVRLTLERPLGSQPEGLEPLPRDRSQANEVILANHRRANSLVLQTCEARPRDGRFECDLKLPGRVPWPRLTVRALAATQTESALGVLTLKK
jgi:peptidase C25-like protein